MRLFFDPKASGNAGTLTGDEAKHCCKVLRLNAGDQIEVVDGKGTIRLAELVRCELTACTYRVLSTSAPETTRKFKLHIAMAPPKSSDRLELFIEKAAEVGIDEITPIICQRSERKKTRTDRLERILISAIKQSKRAVMPTINASISFAQFMKDKEGGFLCHLPDNQEISKHLSALYTPGNDCLILIGPEGDFSPEEIDLAVKKNFKLCTLGTSRLRTETAGLYACIAIHIINETPSIHE